MFVHVYFDVRRGTAGSGTEIYIGVGGKVIGEGAGEGFGD